MLKRLTRQGHPADRTQGAGQAAIRVGEGSPDDLRNLVVREGFEAVDAQPRQERGIDLEIRVLGCGSGKGDGAVLNMRKQGVLLGLVESVDLVDEQDGRLSGEGEPVARLSHQRPDLGDAAHDGGYGHEACPGCVRQDPREARLAASRRTPEEEGPEVAALQGAAERPALADQALVTDDLV